MKRNLVVMGMLLMAVVFAGSTYASNPGTSRSSLERGEFNLIKSLESDNYGVRTSAAQILGEMNSTKAVIPLMKMLKSSEDEKERIIAAVSLSKIESSMGRYSVSQQAKFDNSPRVRKICVNFANYAHVKTQNAENVIAVR